MKLPGAARIALFALILLVAGCDSGNPILGTWRMQPPDPSLTPLEQQAVANMAAMLGDMAFTEDAMVIGAQTLPVTYEIDGDTVIVWSNGRGTTFEVDGRVMTMVTAPNPDTGRVFRIKFDRL